MGAAVAPSCELRLPETQEIKRPNNERMMAAPGIHTLPQEPSRNEEYLSISPHTTGGACGPACPNRDYLLFHAKFTILFHSFLDVYYCSELPRATSFLERERVVSTATSMYHI